MPTSDSTPAQPPSATGRNRLSRRTFMAAAVAAAGSALALPGRTSAAPRQAPAAGSAQATWSSESTASGYAPKSGTWYTDPATGLAAVAHKLSRQADIALAPAGSDSGQVINVDPATAYQSILGIGSSMEDSTIHNLSLMSDNARAKAIAALFDPAQGAGLGLVRICFGTSDFSHPPFYTYDDGPADPTLANFSIQKDIDNHIVSTLKEALQVNPDLVVFGTAWSAPAWMKDNNSLIDGHLLDQYIPTLARYYRMIVQAYAEQGITIHAVSPQNEPGWPAGHYPSMLVSAKQEQQLVNAMRAEFDAAGLGTEIWAWDWNFGDVGTYLTDMLGSSGSGYTDAYASAKAIAWHDYSGDPSVMSQMKSAYPKLDMIMTERMLWGTAGTDRIAQYLRNWSTGYVSWVTMLDQNRATQQYGTPDPTPLVQDPDDRDTYWALPEYYLFGQFSKFVQRGAKRIWSDYGSTGTVTTVAFLNPDNTVTTVVINQTTSPQNFTLRSQGRQLTHTLPAKTTGTYVWSASLPIGSGTDAYGTIQAEAYTYASGVGVENTSDTGGGQDIGWLANGDWAEYDNVAFGTTAASQVKIRVASGAASNASGQVEVRLDSRTSTPIASIPVSSTGGWQTWTTQSAGLSGVTGTHTVYLTFASGQSADFVNVNWFTFTHDSGTDAYGTIQAEAYINASGVGVENTTDTGGGQDIGWLANGDWAEYDNVAFGTTPATQFQVRVASGAASNASGQVEVRLDSRTSTPIATIPVANTGGWQSWTTKSAGITGVTGTHTVYLTFTSSQSADFVNVNWFTFTH